MTSHLSTTLTSDIGDTGNPPSKNQYGINTNNGIRNSQGSSYSLQNFANLHSVTKGMFPDEYV